MKILLIVPNLHSYDVFPSLSVACLQSYINEKTVHHAEIIDFSFHKRRWKYNLATRIQHMRPDVIGFSVLSFNYNDALNIAHFIKNHFSLPIIFGGIHTILSPDDVIKQNDVDIICTGEGEHVLHDLLDQGLNCRNIVGLWYKQDGKIIKNSNRQLIECLDNLPFPDYTHFAMKDYFSVNHNHIPIMASRGCPYDCTYCSNHALKKTLEGCYVRQRSVDNVLEEVYSRVNQFKDLPKKFFYFFDDTFILNKQFVNEFCTRFREQNLHHVVKWTVNVRANLIDEHLLKTLKEAGCYEVRMGVESGNNHLRNTVYKRNMSNQQLETAFHLIKKIGLRLRLDFIYGAPSETLDMMKQSLSMAKHSQAENIFFTPLYPLPGTEIRKICEKEHIIEDIDKGSYFPVCAVDHTCFVSVKQMRELAQNIRRWQMQRYIKQGFRIRGFYFFLDVLVFLLYCKWRYGLEFNQVYRWNVQKAFLDIEFDE